MARHHLDGRPFYCKTCGLGFVEWGACEEVECELESTDEAQARKAAADLAVGVAASRGICVIQKSS